MKIKIPGSETTAREPIHQIMHILNSVIKGSKAELFGSKKYTGWCNQQDKVVGYKLALCKLNDDHNKLRKKDVIAEELIQGLSDDVIELSKEPPNKWSRHYDN